jgi:hypothetical protein
VSWFSFLLQDGARPYQNSLTNAARIKSIDFVSIPNNYTPKSKTDAYYLVGGDRIYADKVSDFVCECDSRSNGAVIKRLEKMYDYVFVDELQDFAGYDLDLVEKFFRSSVSVIAVGDPRQATFSTNKGQKNKQFKRSHIHDWIKKMEARRLCVRVEKTDCHRGNQHICDFADALYPSLPKTRSLNIVQTGHDGIFSIKAYEVRDYYDRHLPMVLRYSKTTSTMDLPAMNIGATKGRTYERVLIFPTKPMRAYLDTKDLSKAGDISKLYVAVTRARFSVAFVV